MRMLKKIIRKLYHLIWFLGAFLIFTPSVFAVQGNPNLNGVDFYTPTAATFLDNTNGRLTQLATSWNNNGKYYSADMVLNGASTDGGNLNFTALEPVVNGYSYILSVVVGGSTGMKTSTNKLCIAENLANNITRWNNDWCVAPFYKDEYSGIAFNVANSDYPTTIGYSVLYFGFTSNITAKSIQIVFNSTQSMASTVIFGGYRLELISDNSAISQGQIQQAVQNSGLATANSVSQVQSSINQVKQEIQGMEQQQQQTNDKLDDVNDNLTDETAPGLDLSDLEVSSDTPISDLITMPLTILNSLSQALDGTCSNYTIPFFYNNSITFPCFTISDYLGSTVTNYIDLFICFYMCYNIAMLVVSVFEDITSLRDIYDSLYVPKHADTGYQPRHAKGGGS